ncbi:MAG: hypothetical protein QGH40_12630 [bacterium]|nr:hypothetical protein [bacterium]
MKKNKILGFSDHRKKNKYRYLLLENGFSKNDLEVGCKILKSGYITMNAETRKFEEAFAKKLKPTMAKFSITIPFPSTPLFEEWEKKGYILSKNWDEYGFYQEKKIYEHPNLSWEMLTKYLDMSYKSFYFSPSYMISRFFSSIKNGSLVDDLKMAARIKW